MNSNPESHLLHLLTDRKFKLGRPRLGQINSAEVEQHAADAAYSNRPPDRITLKTPIRRDNIWHPPLLRRIGDQSGRFVNVKVRVLQMGLHADKADLGIDKFEPTLRVSSGHALLLRHGITPDLRSSSTCGPRVARIPRVAIPAADRSVGRGIHHA
jgi:hypothetical protein